jgi:glycosyltransferase involved in cell wall biosynthesis
MPQTFVFLSTTDWDAPQFGSRQQVARQLAGRGHRVLFVEVPRALHSLISDPAGTRRAIGRLGQSRVIASNLVAYTPLPVLPLYYHPLASALNQRLLAAYVRRALRHLDWAAGIVWTYWPNSAAILGRLGEKWAVYHCIDDFTAVSYPLVGGDTLRRLEADLCRRVDLIFTRTDELKRAKEEHNPRTFCLPGGVDTADFDPERVRPAADLLAIPAPRVGFVGTLDDRIDVPALAWCARQLSHVSFAFVGPSKRHKIDLGPLEELANVYFRPARPYPEVPAAVAALDIGLIPYRLSPYTAGLSPIKLYEYLAMGKPVVGANLPYLRREAAAIQIARSPEEYAALTAAQLAAPPSAGQRAAWRRIAESCSWQRQVDTVEDHLARLTGDEDGR